MDTCSNPATMPAKRKPFAGNWYIPSCRRKAMTVDLSIVGINLMARCSLTFIAFLVSLAAACNPRGSPSQTVAIPQSTASLIAVTRMASLIEGRLVYENGCLRVRANDDEGALLVWPAEYAAVVSGDTVQVTTGQLGGDQDQEVITLMIGSWVRLGGGGGPIEKIEPHLQQQVPPQCSGLVWIVGTIYSATPTPP